MGVRPGVQVWTEGDKEYLGAQLGAGQPWGAHACKRNGGRVPATLLLYGGWALLSKN